MIKPVSINSSIDFVIVGPIGSADGILLQSVNLETDLSGVANLLYRKGQDDTFVSLNSDYIQFLWGNVVSKSGRKQKILLCWISNKFWKLSEKENAVDIYLDKYRRLILERKNLQEIFNSFIENSYSVLLDLVEGQNIKDTHYEMVKSKLQWHISPLLLACHYD